MSSLEWRAGSRRGDCNRVSCSSAKSLTYVNAEHCNWPLPIPPVPSPSTPHSLVRDPRLRRPFHAPNQRNMLCAIVPRRQRVLNIYRANFKCVFRMSTWTPGRKFLTHWMSSKKQKTKKQNNRIEINITKIKTNFRNIMFHWFYCFIICYFVTSYNILLLFTFIYCWLVMDLPKNRIELYLGIATVGQ